MRSPTAQGPFHTCQVHAWNDVAFSSAERDRHLEIRPLSPLNTQPMVSPVNASRLPSRVAAHHSGPERLAKPYSVEDFHLLILCQLCLALTAFGRLPVILLILTALELPVLPKYSTRLMVLLFSRYPGWPIIMLKWLEIIVATFPSTPPRVLAPLSEHSNTGYGPPAADRDLRLPGTAGFSRSS